MTIEELSSQLDALENQFTALRERVAFLDDALESLTRRTLNLEEAHE